jgi:hypothetical protein
MMLHSAYFPMLYFSTILFQTFYISRLVWPFLKFGSIYKMDTNQIKYAHWAKKNPRQDGTFVCAYMDMVNLFSFSWVNGQGTKPNYASTTRHMWLFSCYYLYLGIRLYFIKKLDHAQPPCAPTVGDKEIFR